jgi:signal recognition particle GTPase
VDQDRPVSFDLTDEEMEQVFQDEVLGNYRNCLENVNYPLLAILAGQPGSGKTTTSRKTIPALHGLDPDKVLRIDIDTFRKYHPAYDDIPMLTEIQLKLHTRADFGYWC